MEACAAGQCTGVSAKGVCMHHVAPKCIGGKFCQPWLIFDARRVGISECCGAGVLLAEPA